MRKLLAVIAKELLLLFRDRAGLVVLFLMPAVLTVVVSLVQENVLKATGGAAVRMLFVDRDQDLVGKTLAEQLARSDALELVKDGLGLDDAAIQETLGDGAFQFCLVVPKGMSETLRERVGRLIAGSIQTGDAADALVEEPPPQELTVYFDPLVQGAFRAAVQSALEGTLMAIEIEMKARAFSEIVPAQGERVLQLFLGASYVPGLFPRMNPEWGNRRLLAIRSTRAIRAGLDKLPTSVQQNVPAWALFGMFFIVVPLGGSLIRERQTGTLRRLMSLPVSFGVLLLGKVLAYVLVCLSQFGLILVIGRWGLPLFGTDALSLGPAHAAVFLVVLSAALAAAGYAILVGGLARTYEQASMFGAVSVVIAAALGGVMVPVYAMPRVMQEISRFSPLAWGLDALTDLFARGGDLSGVLPEIALLTLFSALAMLGGWWGLNQRMRRGP